MQTGTPFCLHLSLLHPDHHNTMSLLLPSMQFVPFHTFTVLAGMACLVSLNIPSLTLVARMLATKLMSLAQAGWMKWTKARMGEMFSWNWAILLSHIQPCQDVTKIEHDPPLHCPPFTCLYIISAYSSHPGSHPLSNICSWKRFSFSFLLVSNIMRRSTGMLLTWISCFPFQMMHLGGHSVPNALSWLVCPAWSHTLSSSSPCWWWPGCWTWSSRPSGPSIFHRCSPVSMSSCLR